MNTNLPFYYQIHYHIYIFNKKKHKNQIIVSKDQHCSIILNSMSINPKTCEIRHNQEFFLIKSLIKMTSRCVSFFIGDQALITRSGYD